VRAISGLCLLALVAAMCADAQTETDPLARANVYLQSGEADKALELLSSLPQSGTVRNLRCRVQYGLEHWDAAVDECEQALATESQNSDYHMWLGRALGEKAERASFMTAFSLAKKVCAEFETAARLNPRNAEALADLGEFYSSAPGVVGGGDDKAERVATELESVDQARAHELRGRIAESRKDYGAAEHEFRQAIATSQHPAFQWMTLASYFRRRQQWSDLDAAVESGLNAVQRDKRAGVALFNGSSVLSRAARNLPLSAKMLEDYLAGTSLTEEGPAFVAHTRLARLKYQLGDTAAALHERTQALELAHDYQPALDLKFEGTVK
jgi:tetratricopeptide (TPR) repeat protein